MNNCLVIYDSCIFEENNKKIILSVLKEVFTKHYHLENISFEHNPGLVGRCTGIFSFLHSGKFFQSLKNIRNQGIDFVVLCRIYNSSPRIFKDEYSFHTMQLLKSIQRKAAKYLNENNIVIDLDYNHCYWDQEKQKISHIVFSETNYRQYINDCQNAPEIEKCKIQFLKSILKMFR